MPSFRCPICLDAIHEAAQPMSTLCGHIFCLDCATFHFTANDTCAVCRKQQTLDKLIRLFPTWETGAETEDAVELLQNNKHSGPRRDDGCDAHNTDSAPPSPISIRYIDRAAKDIVHSLQTAIADRSTPQEALLACNTFVNSVPGRVEPHINSDLLHEISFQLRLLDTKLEDARTERMEVLQSARANETRLNISVAQQRAAINDLEEEKGRLRSRCKSLITQVNGLREQCSKWREESGRQGVRTAMAESKLEELERSNQEWMAKATKFTKKYYALKNQVKEAKRAASDMHRGQSNDTSDDLLVI